MLRKRREPRTCAGSFDGKPLSGDTRTSPVGGLEEFAGHTGVDGFNIAYHTTPGSFLDVAEHLIPELRRLGRAWAGSAPTTLRQRIFGADALLPEHHPAAAFRRRRILSIS